MAPQGRTKGWREAGRTAAAGSPTQFSEEAFIFKLVEDRIETA
jgi:hypothetical protein